MRIILKPMGIVTIAVAIAGLVAVIAQMRGANTAKKSPIPVNRLSVMGGSADAKLLIEAEDSFDPQGGGRGVGIAHVRSARGGKGIKINDVVRMTFPVVKKDLYKIVLRLRSGRKKNGGQPTVYWDEDAYEVAVDGKPTPFTGDRTSVSSLDPTFDGIHLGSMTSAPISLATGKHYLDVKLVRIGSGFVDYIAIEAQ